ncbi:MAG: hypothetical protein IPF68_05345 [Bacteroidales bacterium]|nr:hypothetical protein [Bacteroidales bacterium]
MKKILTILLISGLSLNLMSQEVKLNTNLVVEADGTVRMDNNATCTDLI